MTCRTAQILPLSCHLGMLARGLMGQRAGRPLAGTGALPIPRIWPLCAMSLDTPMGEATTIMIRKEGIIMAMRKQNPFWEEITSTIFQIPESCILHLDSLLELWQWTTCLDLLLRRDSWCQIKEMNLNHASPAMHIQVLLVSLFVNMYV